MDKYFAAPQDAPPWVPRRGEVFLHAIAVSPERSEEAQQQIIEILRVRRHLPSNKPNDFAVFTDEVFVSLYQPDHRAARDGDDPASPACRCWWAASG